MAESNVTLRVRADTSDARREVKETTGDIEKMNAAAKKTQGAANAATGGGAGGGTGTPPVDTKQAARHMADEFGKRAGAAMGKLLVSFMVNQGVGTAFSLMRKPGEDSRRIDQVESTVQGAIQWGGAGATVAGPIGAVVGGLLGGLNSFILKEKEIRDSLAKSRIDYDRERGAARINSARSQEERFFSWSLGLSSPEEQAKLIQERAKALQGAGEGGDKVAEAYLALVRQRREAAPRQISGSGSIWAGGATVTVGDEARYRELSQQVADRKADFDKALQAVLGGNLENAPELGGNKTGTANWYRGVWEYAKSEYGMDDERTGKVKAQLDAVNSMGDSLKDKELEVYLGQLDRAMGFASRSAITDSASSKGLGVGAQIGGMANERMLGVVQEILKAVRNGQKDVVETIRARGGVPGMLGIAL